MAYSNFTLEAVQKTFQLENGSVYRHLFRNRAGQSEFGTQQGIGKEGSLSRCDRHREGEVGDDRRRYTR